MLIDIEVAIVRAEQNRESNAEADRIQQSYRMWFEYVSETLPDKNRKWVK